jgi:predicted house-cleaning noncanonical NTP pyrophosphatase (MazG superfamily)
MFDNILGMALGMACILVMKHQEFQVLILRSYCQELQQLIEAKNYSKLADIL